MAVPRLRDPDCFVELDPGELADLDEAPTVSGLADHGVAVPPEALPPVDLIVTGSVAVTESGARVGKGEGYSDLEYALLRETGLVDDGTPVATTVHERQVIAEAVAVGSHDVPIDVIVTPERTIRTETAYDAPTGVDPAMLSQEQIEAIPVLASLLD